MRGMPEPYVSDPNYNNYWTKEADEGKGQFAVAVALLEVAKSGHAIASAIRWLGTGDAATSMGAIEYLSANLGEKLQSLGSIADSIEHVASAIASHTEVTAIVAGNGKEDRQ